MEDLIEEGEVYYAIKKLRERTKRIKNKEVRKCQLARISLIRKAYKQLSEAMS